jgi:hypothetical protein
MTALNLKEETLASIPPPHIAGKQNFVPLAVRNTCPLSAEEIVKLSRIEDYDLDFLCDYLKKHKSHLIASHLVDEAVYEFRRWIALKLLGFADLRMVSQEMDEVWHTFILFTKDYQQFCETAVGRFIHHYPKGPEPERRAVFVSQFRDAYSSVFGEVPGLWLLRANTDCC